MICQDPYDPDAFERHGHAVINLLADYFRASARPDGPVLDYRPPAEILEHWPSTLLSAPGLSLIEPLPKPPNRRTTPMTARRGCWASVPVASSLSGPAVLRDGF